MSAVQRRTDSKAMTAKIHVVHIFSAGFTFSTVVYVIPILVAAISA